MSALRCAGCYLDADRDGVRRRVHLVHAVDRRHSMAGLLGLLTGVLAFIPNIGAITSGS